MAFIWRTNIGALSVYIEQSSTSIRMHEEYGGEESRYDQRKQTLNKYKLCKKSSQHKLNKTIKDQKKTE